MKSSPPSGTLLLFLLLPCLPLLLPQPLHSPLLLIPFHHFHLDHFREDRLQSLKPAYPITIHFPLKKLARESSQWLAV